MNTFAAGVYLFFFCHFSAIDRKVFEMTEKY